MTDTAIFTGIIFMIFCVYLSLIHSRHYGRVSLVDWSILAMGGIYGGGWALVISATESGDNPEWERWIIPYNDIYILHTLCATILLCATFIGWKVSQSLFKNRNTAKHINISENNKRLIFSAWSMFAISFTAQWIYSNAYGGLFALLDYSVLIRAGVFEIQNSFSFLQPFGGLTIFSSFIFFGLWLSENKKINVKFGLLLSFCFSIYILISLLGRIGFLVYFATFFLGFMQSKNIKPQNILIGGGSAIAIILIIVYYMSVWFDFKAADNIIVFLAREISYPFGSFFGQVDYEKNLFRLFQDFLYAPIYLLPSSLWTNWVENVGQINTALIMGAAKGTYGVTGAIPVDLLTLGVMQASIFGIFIVGIIFGIALHLIKKLLEYNFINSHVYSLLESYVAIKIAVLAIFYSQPALVVSGNFDLLISLLLMATLLRLPKFKFSSARHSLKL